MKRRLLYSLTIIILMFVLGLFVIWSSLNRKSEEFTGSAELKRATLISPVDLAQPSASNAHGSTPKIDLKKLPKDEAFQRYYEMRNQTPQDFYGKVIDQFGAPVVGAEVTGNIMLLVSFSGAEKIERYMTKTDAQGLFEFVGLKGSRISAVPRKDGYELGRYEVAYQMPRNMAKTSLENRCVITMWKKAGAEAIVHIDLNRVGIPVDGTPVMFDLLAGQKVSSGGDMIVSITRNPINLNKISKFDWNATVKINNGGLVEITGGYANQAPKEGYRPEITIVMAKDAIQWKDALEGSYYFKGRNGKIYGRMTLRLSAYYDPPPTGFSLDAYINPNGSRNLEYDPTKRAP